MTERERLEVSRIEFAFELCRQANDRSVKVESYKKIGNAYHRLGDFRNAVHYHERSLEIAKEIVDKTQQIHAHGNLGKAYQGLGDFKTALENHERALTIAKDLKDLNQEGIAYGNIGNVYDKLGDFQEAIKCHERCLEYAQKVGDRVRETNSYGNIGNVYDSLGDYQTSLYYHQCCLKICKEDNDRSEEGRVYGNIGIVYDHLGDFKKAIDNHECCLKLAKEVGDKHLQGGACNNIGNVYQAVGDLRKAKDYFEQSLNIAKDIGDKSLEKTAQGSVGQAYLRLGNYKRAINSLECCLNIAKETGEKVSEGQMFRLLGTAYRELRDYENAINYLKRGLAIAKEVEDLPGEGLACGQLGKVYFLLRNFATAIIYLERHSKIVQRTGNRAEEAAALCNLGCCFESVGLLDKALECFYSSVEASNDVRGRLQSNDKWKISLREQYQCAYTALWEILTAYGRFPEALRATEGGRAQALNDLMETNYGISAPNIGSVGQSQAMPDIFRLVACNILVSAFNRMQSEMNFWVIQSKTDVHRRVKEEDKIVSFIQALIDSAFKHIGARAGMNCEDRSLDTLRKPYQAKDNSHQARSNSQPRTQNQPLRQLYDFIVDPIADLIHGDEIIIVPEGPLWLAPFAAFMDSNSKYLSESLRIRVTPSLTSLNMILDCPADYHSSTGALLVGDPWVQEVTSYDLCQLPCAREEVKMIGQMLNTAPLIGKDATKNEVLARISSAALIHIAAHGRMETGEIALCPNPSQASSKPKDEDFLLTITDVLKVKLRARLVVLSCCHSGRGDIKAEGVVGIARAFLGAGARSVLVSLWAIDDEATLEFMKCFYQHIVKGRRAGEALNLAMKSMRESEKFHEVKYWAPFVLVGDDVTLEFDRGTEKLTLDPAYKD